MENTTNQQDEKGHDANIVLAVSGLTAISFLRAEVKKATPFSPFGLNKLPYVLFDAVAQVMEDYKAACASSGEAQGVSAGLCGCATPNDCKELTNCALHLKYKRG